MWDDLAASLTDLGAAGRLRELRAYRQEGVCLIDALGNRLVNFGSNDYLGLAEVLGNHVCQLASSGSTASALVCGWTDRHQALADTIARFEQTESAVIFPSGYAACSGVVAALGRSGDLILSDRLNHASLIDGCRLAKADRLVYPHRDVEAVSRMLAQHRSRYQRVWIVTDTVFSMDGHLAPLAELCDLAEQYDAALIVDEAHATGVLGASGRGACEALGVSQRIQIRIGTLSKALGGQGGFVACPQPVASFLVNHCRSFIYSTALSMPAVESALMALADLSGHPERRVRVGKLSQQVRDSLGIGCGGMESTVPIIPIEIGSDTDTVAASQRLRELGLFVPAIRPPTVPEGQARLRVSLSANHRDDMVSRLTEGLRSL